MQLDSQIYNRKESECILLDKQTINSLNFVVRLLVGAPKAQSIEHEDIVKGGLVYHCPIINSSESCQIIAVDPKGQTRNREGIQTANKSHQLFGSTVRSAGPDSYVLMCAPNHVRFFDMDEPDEEEHVASGICYIVSNVFTSPEHKKFQPCKDYTSMTKQMCQLGFSGVMFEDSFVVGAPGSYFWQGQVFLQTLTRPQLLKTQSKSTRFDDTNQGYSIAVGDLDGNGTIDYVTGSPKRYNMFGSVLVYSSLASFQDPLFEIIGYQFGAYFGHSVEAADLNGDGLDDLIVGAPTYSDAKAAVPLHDVGRIYIYYQQDSGILRMDPQVIQGLKGSGRFGFTLAALGDINLDGFNDLAVSAPYENNDEGAVYIFSGYENGLRSTASQIITPPKHGARLFRGFGFALSGNFDIDENGYTDLLVGAPHSSSVILYRTNPIIRLALNIEFDVNGVTFRNHNLELPDGSTVVGFNTTACLQYEGTNVNDDANFRCSLKADSLRTVKTRAVFIHEGVQREIVSVVHAQKSQTHCMTYTTFLKNNIEEYNPLVFTMRCSLLHESLGSAERLNNVLPNIEEIAVSKLPIFTNCSSENCFSDLQLVVQRNIDNRTESGTVTIGEPTPINVTVTIGNLGFEVYGAQLFVSLPQGIYYSDVRRTDNHIVSCSLEGGSMTVICDLESPFMGDNHSVSFDILLTADKVDGSAEIIDIAFHVTSSIVETGERASDNSALIRIPVDARVSVKMYSDSMPTHQSIISDEEYVYYPTYQHELEVGQEVTHVYAVQNLGPSDISRAELTIYWPMHSYYGYLLYLVNVTLSTGEICHVDNELNPMNLELIQREISAYSEVNFTEQTNSTASDSDPYESVTEGYYIDIPTNITRNNVKRTVEKSQTAGHERETRYRDFICKSGKEECYTIRCQLTNLIGSKKRNIVTVQLRSRLWNDTFKLLPGNEWRFTSTAVLNVTHLPYSVQPNNYPTIYASTTTAVTKLEFTELPSKDPPLWIIIFSIFCGILLLAAILGLLTKIGFFTRSRNFKKMEEEKEEVTPVDL
ncbi:alpha integrin subunit SU2 [Apostichopus japonicus]|uniref:Alpha integrin subunit SU2 n=1 Tax=Stichopus japonicus TaxID=307972 RepID=A0A2G8KAG3_STIJA|nr:alpha integrin subunit SU2 [Apostichopus japonicus]